MLIADQNSAGGFLYVMLERNEVHAKPKKAGGKWIYKLEPF